MRSRQQQPSRKRLVFSSLGPPVGLCAAWSMGFDIVLTVWTGFLRHMSRSTGHAWSVDLVYVVTPLLLKKFLAKAATNFRRIVQA